MPLFISLSHLCSSISLSRCLIMFKIPMSPSPICFNKLLIFLLQKALLFSFHLMETIDNYKCEDWLHRVTNTRHRIALTKLRLSSHKLAIETGRYSRPFKKPAERTWRTKYHFLNICPAYQEKRCSLLDYLEKEYRIKISRMSPNRIFMFLINPPAKIIVKIQKLIAKHIFEWFEKRKGEDGKK